MISLELKNLSVSFGPNRILTDLDAVIPGGAITSVIGQNGGGKTTLLKAVAGLVDTRGPSSSRRTGANARESA